MPHTSAICVFCGSSIGTKPIYSEAARQLGETLVSCKQQLVYGAGNVGLMGLLADTVLRAGGTVIGVIPKFLAKKEVAHTGLTTLHVVETMHERKALMMSLSDAFVAMPGGIGTMEEFFEVWTWIQLGLLKKPIGILNTEGFFEPLLTFIDQLVEQRFIKAAHRSLLVVESSPSELLSRLSQCELPEVEKWIDR